MEKIAACLLTGSEVNITSENVSENCKQLYFK